MSSNLRSSFHETVYTSWSDLRKDHSEMLRKSVSILWTVGTLLLLYHILWLIACVSEASYLITRQWTMFLTSCRVQDTVVLDVSYGIWNEYLVILIFMILTICSIRSEPAGHFNLPWNKMSSLNHAWQLRKSHIKSSRYNQYGTAKCVYLCWWEHNWSLECYMHIRGHFVMICFTKV